MPSRRAFLGAAVSAAAAPQLPQTLSAGHGGRVLPPIELPDVSLTLQDGHAASLRSLLRDHATAIQLMFTECTTTCPIGAATFNAVQNLLPDQLKRGVLLLSLDVGLFGDRAATLDTWLKRFHAKPGWLAAVPNPTDLPQLQELFGQGKSASDPHSTRIQIADRSGQLVWRTYELPAAEDIAFILKRI